VNEEYLRVLREIEERISELQELIGPYDDNLRERNSVARALEDVQVEVGWEYKSERREDKA
jgi:hypothetical protein